MHAQVFVKRKILNTLFSVRLINIPIFFLNNTKDKHLYSNPRTPTTLFYLFCTLVQHVEPFKTVLVGFSSISNSSILFRAVLKHSEPFRTAFVDSKRFRIMSNDSEDLVSKLFWTKLLVLICLVRTASNNFLEKQTKMIDSTCWFGSSLSVEIAQICTLLTAKKQSFILDFEFFFHTKLVLWFH